MYIKSCELYMLRESFGSCLETITETKTREKGKKGMTRAYNSYHICVCVYVCVCA